MSFSSDDEPTILPAPGSGASNAGSDGPRLADGQIIGPYRIAGLLGKGDNVLTTNHFQKRTGLGIFKYDQGLVFDDIFPIPHQDRFNNTALQMLHGFTIRRKRRMRL